MEVVVEGEEGEGVAYFDAGAGGLFPAVVEKGDQAESKVIDTFRFLGR